MAFPRILAIIGRAQCLVAKSPAPRERFTDETSHRVPCPSLRRIALADGTRQAILRGALHGRRVIVRDHDVSECVAVLMTLIEALARAGSTLPTSSGEVSIVRAARANPEGGPAIPGQDAATELFRASIRDLQSGSLSQNIELHDGDTIFVPRAELVYVFGEVKNPGGYAVQKSTTVLQALSLAGGVTEHGAMNRVQVMRMVKGQKVETRVKLTDLARPEDTIIVPQRYF